MTSNHRVERSGAIRLRRDGNYAVVEIEHDGNFVELIREYIKSPFYHIIEPAGIRQRVSPTWEESTVALYPDSGLTS